MANLLTLEALSTLSTSVPEWNARLDELHGQIALRQIELARLVENDRPPTRSMKNKGSTESLRPKDRDENPFLSNDAENPEDIQLNPFDTPKSNNNEFTSSPRPGPVTPGRTLSKTSPHPPKPTSNPRPSPAVLTRQSSQPTPTQSRPNAAILRKRKTDSLASAESLAPKYRTRSMIIVYYDKAVQDAFEDLVKFISSSRNIMRKGKMAAKMAEMRRAAELEVGDNDEDDDSEDSANELAIASDPARPIEADKVVADSVSPEGENLAAGVIAAADSDSANGSDFAVPKLKFVSTRQMGPSRDRVKADAVGSTISSVGLLRGYRRAGRDGAPDIFDEVDKGLEWCQSQCERAAHQFLRDGDCSTEIANIKKRLIEVKNTAEKEIEKLKKEEAESPSPKTSKPVEKPRSMQMKTPLMRKEFGASSSREIQVEDMEVDDEGVDDLEPPMKLVFKRSRDVAP